MNAPSITKISGFQGTTREIQHDTDSPIGRLIGAARALLPPILDARNDVIRGSAESLQTTLNGFARSTGRLASYLIDETSASINRTLAASANAANSAREDIESANQQLRWLGQIPPLLDGDTVERGLDQEIRSSVRAMSTKERVELLAEMRNGRHARALLALARSPLPDELAREAVDLYQTTTNSATHQSLKGAIERANDTIDKAATLRRAAEATLVVLGAFDGINVGRGASVAPKADPAVRLAREPGRSNVAHRL